MAPTSPNMVDATPSDERLPEAVPASPLRRTCNDSTSSAESSQEQQAMKEEPLQGPAKTCPRKTVSFHEDVSVNTNANVSVGKDVNVHQKAHPVITMRNSMMELQELEKLTSRTPYEFEWKEHFLPPWRALIGLLAMMECLGYVVPLAVSSWDRYSAPEVEEDTSNSKGIPLLSGLLKNIMKLVPRKAIEEVPLLMEEDEEWWRIASQWLCDHKYFFGFALSFLWFFDAFFLATSWRAKVTADWEREWFLSQYDINGNKKTLGPHEKIMPRECPHDGVLAYAMRLLSHWALLPASFFLLFVTDISEVLAMVAYTPDDAHSLDVDFDSTPEQILSNATDTGTHGAEANMLQLDDTYTTTSIRYCVLYMFVVHMGNVIKSITKFFFKDKIDNVIKPQVARYAVRVTRFALLNPVVFKRRLKKLRTYLRWAKYLTPIIATANKLLGNAKDLIKKHRQRREAIIAQRLRERIFQSLSEEERMERSAIMMQKKFRAWQARKAVRAMEILEGKKEVFAALRMQSHFRSMLARARLRIQQKKARLEHLRIKERNNRDPRRAMMNRTASKIMTDDDRRTMYLLEQDLEREKEKRSKRTMLLRPNTRFAVIWKILFVICVFLEISQKALDPVLAKYQNPQTGERLDVEGVLEATFVPKPMESWKQCFKQDNMIIPMHISPLKVGKKKKKVASTSTHTNNNNTAAAANTAPKKMRKNAPWYCHEPYHSTHSMYINSLKFFIHNFLLLVSCICFLDVFVTFFTGEFNEDDGTLIPKPFFVRWIIPGILLQMLVNPMMGQVFMIVKATARWIHKVGPGRCWRWFTSFILPLLGWMWNLFEWNVWRKLVRSENANTLQRS